MFGFPNLFYNDRYIEKDLKSLLERSDNLMLIQAVDRLRKNHPWNAKSQSSFDTSVVEHQQGIIEFARDIAQNAAFQSNMSKLYLSIALDSKIEKPHWMCKKETYATLSSILLKTPIATLELAFIFLTILTMLMFIFVPMFLALSLLSAEISIMSAAAFLASWGAVLALLYTFTSIEACFKAIEYPFISAAYWIDYGIQSLFGIEFFAFELSELLSKNMLDAYPIAIADPENEDVVETDAYTQTVYIDNIELSDAPNERTSRFSLGGIF